MSSVKWKMRAFQQSCVNRWHMRNGKIRNKVFCIGLNKTGTTSWTQAMRNLGYIVGSETKATMYFDDWLNGDFHRIIKYCEVEGQAFQDIPFSLPGTYRELDAAFPGSKFVLTVRDSADVWYRSLIQFHASNFSPSGSIAPTPEEITGAVYWRKGLIRDYCHYVLGTPLGEPYKQEVVLDFYRHYIEDVIKFFESRPDDLLVLNVATPDSYSRLCDFLGFQCENTTFPWVNKNR